MAPQLWPDELTDIASPSIGWSATASIRRLLDRPPYGLAGFATLDLRKLCALRPSRAAHRRAECAPPSPDFATKLDDVYNSDDALNRSPGLEAQRPRLRPEKTPPPFLLPRPSPGNLAQPIRRAQGDVVLLNFMAPGRPDIAKLAGENPLHSVPNSEHSDEDSQMDDAEDDAVVKPPASADENLLNTARAAHDALQAASGFLKQDADAAVEPSTGGARPGPTRKMAPSPRNYHVPSAVEEPVKMEKRLTVDVARSAASAADSKPRGPGLDAPADLGEVSRSAAPLEPRPAAAVNGGVTEDLLATSPTLREHTIPLSHGAPRQTLPAIHPPSSPARPTSATSPGDKPNLPPLHSHLTQLAEAASKESTQSFDGRSNGTRSHRPSISSMGGGSAQSPPTPSAGHANQDRTRVQYMPRQPYTPSQHSNGQHAPSQTSPASSYNDSSAHEPFRPHRELPTLSPPPGPSGAGQAPYFINRRPSQAPEQRPTYPGGHPPPPTSGEGYAHGSNVASSDGQDAEMDMDGSPARPPQRQQTATSPTAVFKCDYPGCPASPFPTQYLLNSHANVHSQDRPHYCPMPGCPHAEGGKGFKRKNEMIRHGLVHQSPGYTCPFCPDREHKYPRPDNLQR
ncbi:MAG: hypothetical protein M1832_004512 [Thelocarpon impressellum]|nr:MAG: hypothetical protein M1832_004512 [Thelocarpon impressellum]